MEKKRERGQLSSERRRWNSGWEIFCCYRDQCSEYSSLSLPSVNILRCLWFCCVVGSACQQGQNLVRELQTEPSWESWPCSPRPRSSAVLLARREPGRAPGNARSRSTSTTRHQPWTERENREVEGVRSSDPSLVCRSICGWLQASKTEHKAAKAENIPPLIQIQMNWWPITSNYRASSSHLPLVVTSASLKKVMDSLTPAPPFTSHLSLHQSLLLHLNHHQSYNREKKGGGGGGQKSSKEPKHACVCVCVYLWEAH